MCASGQVGVPPGEFWMGSPRGRGYSNEHPQHLVQLSAFCIDRTEVTVAQYRRCVTAGRCIAANTGYACNWDASGRENHPINCVDWNQSRAYCEWVGGALPTEAQWEYAAAGVDGREYPWGDLVPGGQLCWSGVTPRSSTCAVGSFASGASPFGVLDMVGNVWEWTSDFYADHHAAQGGVLNPTGPGSGYRRVDRGGGWDCVFPVGVRARYRLNPGPSDWISVLGFRCAHGASS